MVPVEEVNTLFTKVTPGPGQYKSAEMLRTYLGVNLEGVEHHIGTQNKMTGLGVY